MRGDAEEVGGLVTRRYGRRAHQAGGIVATRRQGGSRHAMVLGGGEETQDWTCHPKGKLKTVQSSQPRCLWEPYTSRWVPGVKPSNHLTDH